MWFYCISLNVHSFSTAAEELAGGGNLLEEGIFGFSLCNTTVEKPSDLLMHFNYCKSAAFTLHYLLNMSLKRC